MDIIRHLKSIFPLPRSWETDNDLKNFGIRINQRINEIESKFKETIHSNTSTLIKRSYTFPGDILICVVKKRVTVSITSESGGFYYGTVDADTWPVKFSETPVTSVQTIGVSGTDGTNAFVWGSSSGPSKTSTGQVYVARGTSVSSKKIWIQWIGIGMSAITNSHTTQS